MMMTMMIVFVSDDFSIQNLIHYNFCDGDEKPDG